MKAEINRESFIEALKLLNASGTDIRGHVALRFAKSITLELKNDDLELQVDVEGRVLHKGAVELLSPRWWAMDLARGLDGVSELLIAFATEVVRQPERKPFLDCDPRRFVDKTREYNVCDIVLSQSQVLASIRLLSKWSEAKQRKLSFSSQDVANEPGLSEAISRLSGPGRRIVDRVTLSTAGSELSIMLGKNKRAWSIPLISRQPSASRTIDQFSARILRKLYPTGISIDERGIVLHSANARMRLTGRPS